MYREPHNTKKGSKSNYVHIPRQRLATFMGTIPCFEHLIASWNKVDNSKNMNHISFQGPNILKIMLGLEIMGEPTGINKAILASRETAFVGRSQVPAAE